MDDLVTYPSLSLSACVLLVLLSLSSPALTSPPFPTVSWISRIQTTAHCEPAFLPTTCVRTGGTLGDPSAWFLGSVAFAAVGFAEPEPPEMTVDELKLQARASGGHGAKDQFPVGMRVLQMVSNFTAQSTASSAAMHGHGGILGETDSPKLQEAPFLSCDSEVADKGFWTKLKDAIHQFIEELMAPPTKSAVCFGISLLTLLWHVVGIGRTKSDVDATSWIR
jgi:hypothetical protein